MLKVRLIEAENLRRVLVGIFYAAYAVAIGYLLTQTQDPETRKVYWILLAILPFGVWTEVLRYLFYRATQALYHRCDPEEAGRLAAFVRKCDFLRQYDLTAPNLEGYALLDSGRPQEVAARMEELLRGYSKRRLNVDFEYQYLMFSAYAELGKKEELKQSQETLERIFRAVPRPPKSLQSLRELTNGIFCLRTRRIDEALERFQAVQAQCLRPREQYRFYIYYSQALAAGGLSESARDMEAKAAPLAGKITLFAK